MMVGLAIGPPCHPDATWVVKESAGPGSFTYSVCAVCGLRAAPWQQSREIEMHETGHHFEAAPEPKASTGITLPIDLKYAPIAGVDELREIIRKQTIAEFLRPLVQRMRAGMATSPCYNLCGVELDLVMAALTDYLGN